MVVVVVFVMKGEVWGSGLGCRRVEKRCGAHIDLCQSHFASGWPQTRTTENCSDANKQTQAANKELFVLEITSPTGGLGVAESKS